MYTMYFKNQNLKNDLHTANTKNNTKDSLTKSNTPSFKESKERAKIAEDLIYIDTLSSLVSSLKSAVDEINSSDYSKKSLGRFKERIERILSDLDYPVR